MDAIIFTASTKRIGWSRGAGALRIASHLRQKGRTALVADQFDSMSYQEACAVVDTYRDAQTQFVGFSTTLMSQSMDSESENNFEVYWNEMFCHDNQFLESLFQYCRSKNLKVVVGGAKVGLVPCKLPVDYWVVGTGEDPVMEILEGKGVPRMQGNPWKGGPILYTPEDHLFKNEWLPIETSRGCVNHCAFCTRSQGYMERDLAEIQKELLNNYEQYGTKGYTIYDELINPNPQRLEALCRMFQELPFEIEWLAFARLDGLAQRPDLARSLQEAGCRGLFFGIETFNKEAGQSIGKGLGEANIKQTLKMLKNEWGDRVMRHGSFITGIEGESDQAVLDTARFVADNDDLHTGGWNPLLITPKEFINPLVSQKMSEDAQQYQIQLDESKDGKINLLGWKSPTSSGQRALDLYFRVNEIVPRRKRPGFWKYSQARNAGCHHAQIVLATKSESTFEVVTHKTKEVGAQWVAEYKESLLSPLTCQNRT